MTTTAIAPDLSVPPEWAPQKAIWTAWPANASEWDDDLERPRRDIAALVHALVPTNSVKVLIHGAEAKASATAALGYVAELVPARYGDVWLRDTGPVFARDGRGPVALRFQTNGWGGKFVLPEDQTVGDEIARHSKTRTCRFAFVLEGGAIEHDGAGTVMTTRQTLLNANRNGWNEADAEAALRAAWGARKIIWLDQGLKGDHTDGHVDNLARFVGPGRVVCQSPASEDPNARVHDAAAACLEAARDANGRPLDVIRIPSPGRVVNARHEIAPASYMNFVIANGVVVVPVYGTDTEAAALDRLRSVFRGRTVIGLPAYGLLGAGAAGGGAFHCVTREEPAQ